MAQIPEGKTWFDTLSKSFLDVPIKEPNDEILTEEFLEAAEATTTLFSLLGSVAFNPVKNDMQNNIDKVRARYTGKNEENKARSTTLQQLVRSELASKQHTATEGLLWLVRGLDFTAQALRADLRENAGEPITAQKPKQELADSFRQAYKKTLAPHHSFFIKPVFSAAMGATPYRKDFAAKLMGPGATPQQTIADVEKWVAALEQRVNILNKFLASPEAKW